MKKFGAIITNIALLLLGVLAFIFMSQAYITAKATVLGHTTTTSTNGYDMIEFNENNTDKANLIAISNVFVCVFVALIMLIAIVNLLVKFGVIKNAKFYKGMQIVNIVLTVLTIVFAICAVGAISSIASDLNGLIGMSVTNVGWAAILNIIVPVAMFILALLNLLFPKKSKAAK